MIYSRIAGTGSYLPPRVMTNAEFAERLDTSDAWIRERTGIVERRIADKTQGSSDLALEASERALDAAGLKAGEIDLIIVATSTPDYVFPSSACLLQAKLGVKGSAAFDVQAVCSGFVYGLATADSFIKSRQCKKALVVGAEVFSRILDWNDRGTCVLFSGAPSPAQDTWTWDGDAWALAASGGPSISFNQSYAMAYHEALAVSVLVIGSDPHSEYCQTAEWNGILWALRAPGGPLARSGHAVAYDSAREVIVMFGGNREGPNGETWEWDGQEWNCLVNCQ